MKIAQGNMPCPYPLIRGDLSNVIFPCYAETKLDGESDVYSNNHLISKASGKIRTDCPITNTLNKIVPNTVILFGELHWGEGKAGALYDFLSHAKDDKLNFSIFDVFYPNSENQSYLDRREWLINNVLPKLKGQSQVNITKPYLIEDKEDLDDVIAKNKAEGWEGLVLKQGGGLLYAIGHGIIESQSWVKIKHTYTGDYEVMMIDPKLERMEVNVLRLGLWQGQQKCSLNLVGVKLVNKYKPLVSVGDIVEIEHMGVLAQGGLRHPTFKAKIVSHCTINGRVSRVSKPVEMRGD